MQKLKTNGGDIVPGLLRDEVTGAIVNIDKSGLTRYLSERERVLNNRRELDELKTKVSNIESSLDRIIKLLEK